MCELFTVILKDSCGTFWALVLQKARKQGHYSDSPANALLQRSAQGFIYRKPLPKMNSAFLSLSSMLLNFRLTMSAQKIKLNVKKLIADWGDGGGPPAQETPKGSSKKSTHCCFIIEALSNQTISNSRVLWFHHCWEGRWLSLKSTAAMRVCRRNYAWQQHLAFNYAKLKSLSIYDTSVQLL